MEKTLHFTETNLMCEICLHKTRLILVRFRNNLQCMLFNLRFENISYLRNSCDYGTYIYHCFKNSSPKQRNKSIQYFGNNKTIRHFPGRNILKIILTFPLLLSHSSRRFCFRFWLVAKHAKNN